MKAQDKPRIYTTLVKQFPKALMEVVKRAQYGHKKHIDLDYDYQGFSRLPKEEYEEAMMRHLFEEGEEWETRVDHLGALAWNVLALLEIELRYGNSKVPGINQFTSSDTASV